MLSGYPLVCHESLDCFAEPRNDVTISSFRHCEEQSSLNLSADEQAYIQTILSSNNNIFILNF